MSKTLGDVVNAAGMEIGEPEISAFTDANILHETLIKEANNAVRAILARCRYRWGLHRTTFVTTAVIDDGTVAATNGSTTITSKDSSGSNATNFTSVAVGMFFRFAADITSYKITAVSTASTPHTATIEKAFLGTTTTGSAYKIVKDRYLVTDTDFDEPIIVTINKSRSYGLGSSGAISDRRLDIVDPQVVYNLSGGDLHRDSSGVPGCISRLGVDDSDSTDSPQFLLWPYPDSAYLIELLYTRKFTEQSSFSASLFGSDAPDIAYDAVEYRCCRRACAWDGDLNKVNIWNSEYNNALAELLQRENRTSESGNAMRIATYRRNRIGGMEVRSQIAFDTKSSVRR